MFFYWTTETYIEYIWNMARSYYGWTRRETNRRRDS